MLQIREIKFSNLHSKLKRNNIVILMLKTRVEINKFVLPACIDWNSSVSGLRLANNKYKLDKVGVGPVICLCSWKN